MEKCWFKIISTSKNTSGTIISTNIYFFAIIYTSRNKCIKFIIICEFFPNDIELCNANHAFKFVLQKSTDLFFPVKCYGEQMIQAYEMVHNEIITMHKKLKQQRKLFETCKKCSKNKRIALQNKFVFTTEEILQITKETKSVSVTKSAQK